MSAADGMTLWTGDYLADTTHLSCTQHGAYLLLLMAMWRAGGKLPNNELQLAKIVKLTPRIWRQIAPDVMALMTIEGNWVTQKRLTCEYEMTLKRIEKSRAAGSAGGRAKALKTKEASVATANPKPHLGASKPLANGSGLGLREEESPYFLETQSPPNSAAVRREKVYGFQDSVCPKIRITVDDLEKLKRRYPNLNLVNEIRVRLRFLREAIAVGEDWWGKLNGMLNAAEKKFAIAVAAEVRKDPRSNPGSSII